MSEYLVTFAFVDRLPGSRGYEVGVDLQKDFEHVALLVATIPGDQLGRRQGRQGPQRDRALRSAASAVAKWAEVQVDRGHFDQLKTGAGRLEVPSSELVTTLDHDVDEIALMDGSEISRFTGA